MSAPGPAPSPPSRFVCGPTSANGGGQLNSQRRAALNANTGRDRQQPSANGRIRTRLWKVGPSRCDGPARAERAERTSTMVPRCAAGRGADGAARRPYPFAPAGSVLGAGCKKGPKSCKCRLPGYPASETVHPAALSGDPAAVFGCPDEKNGVPAVEVGHPAREFECPAAVFGFPARVSGHPDAVSGIPATENWIIPAQCLMKWTVFREVRCEVRYCPRNTRKHTKRNLLFCVIPRGSRA